MERIRHSMRSQTARSAPFLIAALLVVIGVAAVPPARAQTEAQPQARPGTYRCQTIEIGDKQSRCPAPSLTLNSDGSYEIWGENGTYEVVQDRWLVLSHSKRRGLGYIAKPGQIIFEYHVGKQTWRVTFERQTAPTGGLFEG